MVPEGDSLWARRVGSRMMCAAGGLIVLKPGKKCLSSIV